jgi:hypothetical protein
MAIERSVERTAGSNQHSSVVKKSASMSPRVKLLDRQRVGGLPSLSTSYPKLLRTVDNTRWFRCNFNEHRFGGTLAVHFYHIRTFQTLEHNLGDNLRAPCSAGSILEQLFICWVVEMHAAVVELPRGEASVAVTDESLSTIISRVFRMLSVTLALRFASL